MGLRGLSLLRFIRYLEDLAYSSNLAADEADLDAMWMKRRPCEDISNHASRQSARGLILLQDDTDFDSRLDALSALTTHHFIIYCALLPGQ